MSARLPQHAAPCLQVRFEFDEPDFAMIDTLFSLAEAHLFMQLVELQDSDSGQLPAGKNTDDLYRQAMAWLVDTQGCCAGKELEFWMHFTQSGCWPRCKISSCTLPAAAAAWVSEERRHVVQAGAALAWLPVGCLQDPARCSHCAAPSDCAADKQSPCSRAVSEGMGWLPHQQDQILSGDRAPAACRARTSGQIIVQVRQQVEHRTPDCCRDVRAAVDLCHRDGSLKTAVAKDPSKYIHEDHRLVMLCQTYKRSGRKLFLATNSLWDYTHVVMNYLLGGRVGPDKNEDWLEFFDVVITGVRGWLGKRSCGPHEST